VYTRCPRFIALFSQVDRLIEKNFVTKRALQTASNFGYDTLMENYGNSSHDTNNTKKIAERKRERERDMYVFMMYLKSYSINLRLNTIATQLRNNHKSRNQNNFA